MADLKPIGSEKLQGQDKISRILQIANYKEVRPSNINETSKDEYSRTLADGNEYHIVKEKLGYVIKKKVNESLEYIDQMQNRKHYDSYGSALKRLNLMIKEQNILHGNDEGISLFGEQKKFVLKTPKPKAPEGDDTPAPPMADVPPAPAEPGGGTGLSYGGDTPPTGGDDMPPPPPGDEMGGDLAPEPGMGDEGDLAPDMGGEEGDIEPAEPDDEGEVTMKTIQKLTGKLGQKIRMINDSVGMTSDDVKYVINSILSALNVSLLDEDDRQDIIDRLEEMPEDMGDEGDESGLIPEPDGMDIGDEGDEGGLIPEPEGEMTEEVPTYGKGYKPGDNHPYTTKVSKIMDSVFAESKVDKVLKSYFNISESEKKFKKNIEIQKGVERADKIKRTLGQIKKLSETVEQQMASEFIIKENSEFTLVGKTNKDNLIFEHEGTQIKITPRGEIL